MKKIVICFAFFILIRIFANEKYKFIQMSPVFRRESEYTFKIYKTDKNKENRRKKCRQIQGTIQRAHR